MSGTNTTAPRRDRTAGLATAALVATLLLVAVGGFTRGSGSGYGCGDRWPLCHDGALGGLLPRADEHMIVEWSHRWLAAIVGILVLATLIVAWREHRHDRSVVTPAAIALVLVVAQAYLGALVVRNELDADLVSLHLTNAMAVTALLAVVVVQAHRVSGRVPGAWADRGRATWLGAGALATLAVLVLGSVVHDEYVGGWPLVGNEVTPDLATRVVALHLAHRIAAAAGLVIVAGLAWTGHRRRRPRPESVLVDVALACYLLNVALGAAHVFTEVGSTGLVVAHLGVASLAWTCLVVATLLARPDRPRSEASRVAGFA